MGQAAYDYNAVRRRKAPQTQRKADLRVAKGGKRRLSPLQAAVHNAMHLVAAALLVGFAISLLWSESKLVELNDQIQDAKAQLVSEQSQYTYYNSTLNSKTNITSVEETAGRLGLMKIDQSQITYIRLGESDTLERTQSAVRQWTAAPFGVPGAGLDGAALAFAVSAASAGDLRRTFGSGSSFCIKGLTQPGSCGILSVVRRY